MLSVVKQHDLQSGATQGIGCPQYAAACQAVLIAGMLRCCIAAAEFSVMAHHDPKYIRQHCSLTLLQNVISHCIRICHNHSRCILSHEASRYFTTIYVAYNTWCLHCKCCLCASAAVPFTSHVLVGVITTLVTPEHESTLLNMAEELKITLHKTDEPVVEPFSLPSDGVAETPEEVERTKQGLEDIFNLY